MVSAIPTAIQIFIYIKTICAVHVELTLILRKQPQNVICKQNICLDVFFRFSQKRWLWFRDRRIQKQYLHWPISCDKKIIRCKKYSKFDRLFGSIACRTLSRSWSYDSIIRLLYKIKKNRPNRQIHCMLTLLLWLLNSLLNCCSNFRSVRRSFSWSIDQRCFFLLIFDFLVSQLVFNTTTMSRCRLSINRSAINGVKFNQTVPNLNPLINQTINPWMKRSQSINKSATNRSIDQSTSQSTNRIKWSIDQINDQSIDQSNNQSIEQQSTNRPINNRMKDHLMTNPSINRPTNRPTNRPIDDQPIG